MMPVQAIESYAERELKNRLRREIWRGTRNPHSSTDALVAGITVFLGAYLTMELLLGILDSTGEGRTR
jgi:hypothetical protein